METIEIIEVTTGVQRPAHHFNPRDSVLNDVFYDAEIARKLFGGFCDQLPAARLEGRLPQWLKAVASSADLFTGGVHRRMAVYDNEAGEHNDTTMEKRGS